MSRKNQEAKQEKLAIRVWTYEQARKAVPYITSVMHSIREHRLEAMGQSRLDRRLGGRPGRPSRTTMIAQADARTESQKADDRFQNAVGELAGIDVYCVDPIRGEAVIPFLQDNQLAWFIFDLFEADPLRSWRFHDDSPEMRRPIDIVTEATVIA